MLLRQEIKMSLAETQQIFDLLVKIDAILNGIEVKTEQLEKSSPKIKGEIDSFNQLERIALRYLAVARQMGLPDNVQTAINILTRLIVIIRMAQITLMNLATGGTYGTLIAISGFLMTTFAISDFTMSLGE
jgi:hypothetical protein